MCYFLFCGIYSRQTIFFSKVCQIYLSAYPTINTHTYTKHSGKIFICHIPIAQSYTLWNPQKISSRKKNVIWDKPTENIKIVPKAFFVCLVMLQGMIFVTVTVRCFVKLKYQTFSILSCIYIMCKKRMLYRIVMTWLFCCLLCANKCLHNRHNNHNFFLYII